MKRKNWKLIGLSVLLLVSQFLVGLNLLGKKNAGVTAEFVTNEGIQKSGITITHPPDLELVSDDPTTHVLSWTLTEEDFTDALDYLGVYSFTDDTVGSNPAGWAVTEGTASFCNVMAAKGEHSKVIELWDNSNTENVHIRNNFSGQVTGTVEFWIYHDMGSEYDRDHFYIHFKNDDSTAFRLDYPATRNTLYNYAVDDLDTNFIPQVWHHVRIQFNCTSDKFHCWTDEVYRGEHSFRFNQDQINNIHIGTSITYSRSNMYVYLDAIDYSWAPGYYPNRNMDHQNTSSLMYAIFENGVQKINWQQWSNQLQVHHTVSGLVLGGGVHNVSLVFNNRQGQWHHDDVVVNVSESEMPNIPNIVGVSYDPTNPTYQDIVNVTAHVIDSTGIQGVYLETNHTSMTIRDYAGVYSFADEPVGTDPADWTVDEPEGTTIDVVSEKDGHSKVVEIFKDTTPPFEKPGIFNIFPPKAASAGHEIEFWMYGDSNAMGMFDVGNGNFGFQAKIFLLMGFCANTLSLVTNGGYSITALSSQLWPNQWHHFRIKIIGNRAFKLWLNNEYLGQFDGVYSHASFDRVVLGTWSHTGPFSVWVDAVDYSWAPGYYTNRNMDPAGLRNYSMTLSSGTPQDGIWESSIADYPLNENISYGVIAQNMLGNTNVTNQYSFGVFDTLAPNILTITQNPAVPTEEDPLTISVHINDTNLVQEVLIETNHSNEKNYLGKYSFTHNKDETLSKNWVVAGSLNTDCRVIASKNGHEKVLEFYDNNNAGSIGIENTFIEKLVGTIEFWIYPQTSPLFIRFKRSNHRIGTELRYHPGTRELTYYDGVDHKLCDMPSNAWHHIRVHFDCNTEKSSVWVNGILVGTDLTFWDYLCDTVSRFFIGTDGSATGVSYVDAIDYSWAPGYYLNRNMEYDKFNNYSMTLSSGTLQDGIWSFTFNNISHDGSYVYRIHAPDVFGNINSTNQFNLEFINNPLNSPVLAPISPKPDGDGIITLNWSDVATATQYYIYRDENTITAVDALSPIWNTSTSSYQDIITVNGTYYYVIVAGNAIGNSPISNCENVTVIVPSDEVQTYSFNITVYDHVHGSVPYNYPTRNFIIPDVNIVSCRMEITAYCDPDDRYTRAIEFWLDDFGNFSRGGPIGCTATGPGLVSGDLIQPGQTVMRSYNMSNVKFAYSSDYGTAGHKYINFIPQDPSETFDYLSPGTHSITCMVTSDYLYQGATEDSWVSITLYFNEGFDPLDFQELSAPVLSPINSPDSDGIIELNWSSVDGTSTYYIYRNISNITSIAGLVPIANTSATHYQDSICSNGTYYYAILAGNLSDNYSLSNCERVTILIPSNVGVNVTHPPDLELVSDDPTPQTISWTLTADEVSYEPCDYLGLYSFTEAANGAIPSEWTNLDSGNANTHVVESLAGHHQVLEFWDNGDDADWAKINQNVGNRAKGTIEFWEYGLKGTGGLDVKAYVLYKDDDTVPDNIVLIAWIDYNAEIFQVHYQSDSHLPDNVMTNFSEKVWRHIRISWNALTHMVDIWIDQDYKGSFETYSQAVPYMNSIMIQTPNRETSNGFYSYTDAIDYSWAPGYYPNRNMEFTPSPIPKDYPGAYSFTEAANGAIPSEWTNLDSGNANTHVVESLAGHHQVLEFWDNGDDADWAKINQNVGNRAKGTIEFWEYGLKGTGGLDVKAYVLYKDDDTVPDNIVLIAWIDYNAEIFQVHYQNDSHLPDNVMTNFSEKVWRHIRISWNALTHTVDIWIDQDYKGSFETYSQAVPYMNSIMIQTPNHETSNDFYSYTDAIDYSWAPGYYPNRNLDYGTSPVDYLGAYSFTDDVVGSDPVGWTNMVEGADMHHNVISGKAGHSKVVEYWDNTGTSYCRNYNNWGGNFQNGAIEFWLRYHKGTGKNELLILTKDDDGWGVVYLYLNHLADDELDCYYDGTFYKICAVAEDTWYHLRITFEHTGGGYDNLPQYYWNLYVTPEGDTETKYGPYRMGDASRRPDSCRLDITTQSGADGNFRAWVDAVDYSWAPGYYPNRNLDYLASDLTYAIFENGMQKTDWQQWSGQIQVDYNVSGASLGEGTHNVSLVFNDGTGQWLHDDVMVTVMGENPIHPSIAWNVPEDLDFEINLGEGRDCTIAFNFENTGTTTLLNLNFTIDLPLGWSVEINPVSVHRLAPQESASLLFRITAPDSADEFLEVMSIEFEATVLETGENYTDAISIVVAGKTTGNFIWLIVIVGSVAGVASFNLVVLRRRRRECRIQALFTKVLDMNYRPTIQVPIMLEEPHFQSRNQEEVTPPAVGAPEPITGSTLELNMSAQPYFTFTKLCRVFCFLLNTFPLLGALYPEGTRFPQLMELKDLPDEKLHLFFSDHIELIPHSEVLYHLTLMLNELKDAAENPYQILLCNKIEMLLDAAIVFKDRKLLNDLLQLIILMKCS